MKLFFLFLILYFPVFGQTYDYTHNVSNTGDPSIFTNEPSVAAYNNYVVVGCNYNNWGNINRVCSFYSNDKGNSWTQINIPKGFTGSSIDDSDPSVAFDGFGAVYFVYLSSTATHSGVFINKSTNFGQTWLTNSVEVRSAPGATSIDKPYLYVKKGSTLNETKIFVAFRYDNGTNKYIQIVNASAADLNNFSNPYSIRTVSSTSDIQSPIPYCSSSGDVYVTFIEKLSDTQFCIKVSRSSNGGLSFNSPINVSGSFEHIGYHDVEHNQFIYGTPAGKHFRVNSFPSITSINNIIYISWAKKVNGTDRIAISKSTDYGNNWQVLNVENIPPVTGQQFFPWITPTPDKKLCLAYYTCEEINLSSSSIYSLLYLFEENTFEEVDHFDFSQSFSNAGFVGDYINLVSTEDMIYSVFTSNTLVGTQYPTVIKCAAVPNKVNLNLTVYQGTNFSSSPVEININGNVTNIPAGGNPLNYSNSYTFKQIDFLVTGNISGWACRNWSYANTFGNHLIKSYPYTRESDPFQMQVIYEPTLPLTVTNNLEGGSSNDNYGLDWQQNPTPPENVQYGTVYNAFLYENNEDQYTIIAPILNTLGTDWTFYKWDNGSTNSMRSNIKIPDSIPGSGYFTANYKGHLRSNSTNAFSKNTQSKLLRDDNGIYHLFYISMDKLWYTYSLTSNFNGDWAQDDQIEYDYTVKSFSVDILNNDIEIVIEAYNPVNQYGIYERHLFGQPFSKLIDIPSSFFGNALPVIAYTPYEQFILYKKDFTSPLKYIRRYVTLNGWSNWETEASLPNSDSFSKYPSVAGVKVSGLNEIHIVFQSGDRSIKYLYSRLQGNNRTFSQYSDISTGSGYYYNQFPSISLAASLPVVSWTGSPQQGIQKEKKETGASNPRVKIISMASGFTWGSFFETGNNVNYTFNKSVTSTNAESVVCWSEDNGGASKLAKRIGTSYLPNNYCFGTNGIQIGVSNGTSLSNMKAALLNTTILPYVLDLSSMNFSIPIACSGGGGGVGKIAAGGEVTFGRSGVIIKKGVEFIYNIGDILVADSVISFIEHPDTLSYSSAEELNSAVKSSDFYLSPNTNLFFSNFYYVNNKDFADTSLTENDIVSFKAELVRSINEEVVGTFDNITYYKNNLDDYDNIDYEVDLTSIEAGDYYLRLVTAVQGSAGYNLSDIQNDVFNLEKKNYQKVDFKGSELPATYSLEQNYPNPFNPSTTINYQLPQNGFVTLKIYDILGKEVATLVNEQKNQGRYSVDFDASRLASGVYIYQLRANDYMSSKKMLLLK